MKAATLSNTDNSNTSLMSMPVEQEQAVIDQSFVTQSRQTSFSSSVGGDEYSTETVPAAVSGIDMVSTLVDQTIWPTDLQPNISIANHQVVHPLESAFMINNWDPNVFAADLKPQEWNDLALPEQQQQQQQIVNNKNFVGSIPKDVDKNYTFANSMPETPSAYNNNYANNMLQMDSFGFNNNMLNTAHHSAPTTALSTPSDTGLITPPMTNYFQARSSLPTQPTSKKMIYMNNGVMDINRRSSLADTRQTHQRYGKRASSHPSVASVVSLTAHEPISKIIDGIEYITFLYSHDRLVKEYTVRTDVDSVNLDEIVMDFRIQNAIYPRANVDRSEYDGNRWDYETTCNQLGWKLCWLNKEQLFGRRGLIQRAVDSYRNRHAEMRSRRVTRQEKVANGTLRKRRSKKSLTHNTL